MRVYKCDICKKEATKFIHQVNMEVVGEELTPIFEYGRPRERIICLSCAKYIDGRKKVKG